MPSMVWLSYKSPVTPKSYAASRSSDWPGQAETCAAASVQRKGTTFCYCGEKSLWHSYTDFGRQDRRASVCKILSVQQQCSAEALKEEGKRVESLCCLGLLKAILKPSLSPFSKSCFRSWTSVKQRPVKGHTCSTQTSSQHPTNSSPKLQWWLSIWWYWKVWCRWHGMQNSGGMSSWHTTREVALLFLKTSKNQPLFSQLTVPILSFWTQNCLQKKVLVSDPTSGYKTVPQEQEQ